MNAILQTIKPLEDIMPMSSTKGMSSLYDVSLGNYARPAHGKTQNLEGSFAIHIGREMESTDFFGKRVRDALGQFKDRVVVDIGCGRGVEGFHLAQKAGAKAWVGVEGFYAQEALESLANVHRSSQYENPIPSTIIGEDMLAALRRFPDGSVCVFAAGLDMCVLSENTFKGELGQEISRKVANGASFVNVSRTSEIHPPKIEMNWQGVPLLQRGIKYE